MRSCNLHVKPSGSQGFTSGLNHQLFVTKAHQKWKDGKDVWLQKMSWLKSDLTRFPNGVSCFGGGILKIVTYTAPRLLMDWWMPQNEAIIQRQIIERLQKSRDLFTSFGWSISEQLRVFEQKCILSHFHSKREDSERFGDLVTSFLRFKC